MSESKGNRLSRPVRYLPVTGKIIGEYFDENVFLEFIPLLCPWVAC